MEKKSFSETRDFIRSHRKDDVHVLALQAGKYPQVDMQEAVIQIAGWQIAEKKIPSWAVADSREKDTFVGKYGRHPLSAAFVDGAMFVRDNSAL